MGACASRHNDQPADVQRAPTIAKPRFDAFLSHDWQGADGNNHDRVLRVHECLRRLDVRCWVDEEEMVGDIQERMVDGISHSTGVLVFLTARYHDKATGKDQRDNCRFEFDMAMNDRKERLLVVVMEEGMRDTRQWKGKFRAIAMNMYVQLCDVDELTKEQLDMEVRRRLLPQMHWLATNQRPQPQEPSTAVDIVPARTAGNKEPEPLPDDPYYVEPRVLQDLEERVTNLEQRILLLHGPSGKGRNAVMRRLASRSHTSAALAARFPDGVVHLEIGRGPIDPQGQQSFLLGKLQELEGKLAASGTHREVGGVVQSTPAVHSVSQALQNVRGLLADGKQRLVLVDDVWPAQVQLLQDGGLFSDRFNGAVIITSRDANLASAVEGQAELVALEVQDSWLATNQPPQPVESSIGVDNALPGSTPAGGETQVDVTQTPSMSTTPASPSGGYARVPHTQEPSRRQLIEGPHGEPTMLESSTALENIPARTAGNKEMEPLSDDAYYVEPRALQDLEERVTTLEQRIVLLHGPPGKGKSAVMRRLATRLHASAALAARFPDGVFHLEIGRGPIDPQGQQSFLLGKLQELEGKLAASDREVRRMMTSMPAAHSVSQALQNVRGLLADGNQRLVLVDDVWPVQVQLLQDGGLFSDRFKGAAIMTSRDFNLASSVEGKAELLALEVEDNICEAILASRAYGDPQQRVLKLGDQVSILRIVRLHLKRTDDPALAPPALEDILPCDNTAQDHCPKVAAASALLLYQDALTPREKDALQQQLQRLVPLDSLEITWWRVNRLLACSTDDVARAFQLAHERGNEEDVEAVHNLLLSAATERAWSALQAPTARLLGDVEMVGGVLAFAAASTAAFRGEDSWPRAYSAASERLVATCTDDDTCHKTLRLVGDVLIHLGLHAAAKHVRGRVSLFAAAERVMRRVYEGRKRVLGANHTDTLFTMLRVAIILKHLPGCRDEAMAWCEGALGVYTSSVGEQHPDALHVMLVMSRIQTARGQYGEALKWAQRALDGCQATLGPDHVQTVYSLRVFGGCLRETGQLEKALNVIDAFVAVLKPTSVSVHEAVEGLSDLAKDNKPLQAAFREAGAIDRLLDLLRSAAQSSNVFVVRVVKGLSVLAHDNHENMEAIYRLRGVPLLLEMMAPDAGKISNAAAADLLRVLCSNELCQQQILRNKGMEVLLRTLCTADYPAALSATVWAVNALVQNQKSALSELLKQSTIDTLMRCIRTRNAAAPGTIRLLLVLFLHSGHHDDLRRHMLDQDGVLASLLTLMEGRPTMEQSKWTAGLLNTLCWQQNEVKQRMVELKAPKILASVLREVVDCLEPGVMQDMDVMQVVVDVTISSMQALLSLIDESGRTKGDPASPSKTLQRMCVQEDCVALVGSAGRVCMLTIGKLHGNSHDDDKAQADKLKHLRKLLKPVLRALDWLLPMLTPYPEQVHELLELIENGPEAMASEKQHADEIRRLHGSIMFRNNIS